jgi:hypothetical protein
VAIPKANGNGEYGEVLAGTTILAERVGHTQSFVSMGSFDSRQEAANLEKYIKTKFVRALLGVLKVTQDITSRVWEFVPLQDFSPESDIDWSQSISDIDYQLYKKYKLSELEIKFIEAHVKEMD